MDWSNERYVRVYTRETVGNVAMSWQARAIWSEVLQKSDRAGVIGLDGHGMRGLAGLIRMPVEVIEEHIKQLLSDGRVVIQGEYLVVPNYIEAQEAPQSDKQRQRELRARRRDRAMLEGIEETSQNVNTQRDTESQNVTESHVESHGVTSSHSVPSRAVPSRAVPSRTKNKSACEQAFDSFWSAYPVKVGKKACWKAWKRATDKPDIQTILGALHAQRMSKKWTDGFIPNPLTWINQGHWDNGPEIKQQSKAEIKERQMMETLGLTGENDGIRDDNITVTGDDICIIPGKG